jgi:hypothetical protein
MHDPDHPAIVRLRAELDAAWKGVASVDGMDGPHRDRVVAYLHTAVPDSAGRAAREVGREAVLAEIRRFAAVEVVATDPMWPAGAVWATVLGTAAEAARGADVRVR